MRTFIAVEVPQQVRKIIDDFIHTEAKRELPIKWVKFENLHITLKFLGEIDESKKTDITPSIESICGKQNPFTVKMGGLGCFPNPKNPRVIWVGVTQGGGELCTIADALEKEIVQFGFKEEKRFHPHLTIGRVKKRCGVEDILAKTIHTDPFEVSSVVLFKSTLKPEGPVYDELGRFTIG
ncbi:MAG: RNA 2',3'-cyclic phosphodiesterase [candidate division WOR-3 bacterium]|nr:MAG: RNA 2',3'-cyclic phosphodiesterase [candidate division WOR-3 bacterium]